MTEPKTNKEESSATHEPGSHIVNVTSISQSPESISVKNEPITHQSPNNNSTSYSRQPVIGNLGSTLSVWMQEPASTNNMNDPVPTCGVSNTSECMDTQAPTCDHATTLLKEKEELSKDQFNQDSEKNKNQSNNNCTSTSSILKMSENEIPTFPPNIYNTPIVSNKDETLINSEKREEVVQDMAGRKRQRYPKKWIEICRVTNHSELNEFLNKQQNICFSSTKSGKKYYHCSFRSRFRCEYWLRYGENSLDNWIRIEQCGQHCHSENNERRKAGLPQKTKEMVVRLMKKYPNAKTRDIWNKLNEENDELKDKCKFQQVQTFMRCQKKKFKKNLEDIVKTEFAFDI